MTILGKHILIRISCCLVIAGLAVAHAGAQDSKTHGNPSETHSQIAGRTTQSLNQRLQQLVLESKTPRDDSYSDYRIGAEDLLNISVFEAPDLNRTVRVSEDGEISLPLIGTVHAAGLTTLQLESLLEALLKRSYLTDPHVTVFVKEVKSHAISVIGAVEKPGVYEVRGPKTLLEVLSMAQGLADDAGNSVIIMRHGASASSAAADSPDPTSAAASDVPASSAKQDSAQPPTIAVAREETTAIKLNDLLNSTNDRSNVVVNPGDIVKVLRAGIVYVVGEVRKPGGFLLRSNQNISVLQALALAEGLTRTSSAKHACIIRTDATTGARTELPMDLGKILKGRAPDPILRSKDIVFIPNSAGKSILFRGTEAALSIAGGVIVYRR
jgi:polysaccharide export outer membrane protein